MAESRPDVVVVGGGIGGLFAANALIAQGLRVSVFEQAPALGEVGAGVFLTPNSVRQLERVGLGPGVEKRGARVGSGSRYFRQDGTVNRPGPGDGLLGVERDLRHASRRSHRDPGQCLARRRRARRAPVHRASSRTARRPGYPLTTERSLKATSLSLQMAFTPSCGRTFFLPRVRSSPDLSPTGVCWRMNALQDWPTDVWMMWLGKGKHFLTFPVRAGTLINFVGFVPADDEMKESWSAPGDPDLLRREFAGWDPRIESLLQKVQATFRSALYDREPLPTWTRGRLTLLGDAAHPMLPHLGQGANQSIEDGMALATILARADRTTAPAALLAYERLRRERVAAGPARCARERPAIRFQPTRIWASATPRSPPMRRSGSGFTTTTSSPKRRPRRQRSCNATS